MSAADSPFLRVPRSEWVGENALAFALRDRYPVGPGHTLIVPKRQVETWFDATLDEQHALLALVEVVKRELDGATPRPDGYNVGFNAGVAAGQTVMHLHVHVIPRYLGDMDDPRGGVRHVIPSKGNYLHRAPPLSSGGESDPFARHVFPLFDVAERIAIVAAFVQESGLERMRAPVNRSLARGAHVRLLTGDYLAITQASALDLLLDWQRAAAVEDDDDDSAGVRGELHVRVIETDTLPGSTKSFHPKSWRFEGARFGVAFVGSSNISRAALDSAIEWNLRVDRDRDADAYREISNAFDKLWERGRTLDAEWVAAYAERATLRATLLPLGEAEPEDIAPLPPAHEAQLEALAKLRQARVEGRRRALVVLATGLGKTLLSVLDHQQVREETGRAPRLLFIAHRRELLVQAARTFRRHHRDQGERATIGWFAEDRGELGADLVFASVAKLARPEHLARLRQERFDYVVVDEVHHAAAASYRGIIDAIQPGAFLLGLTATPDRADAADVAGLFDDHIAYRAGIERGIELKRLVPFRYFGVKDEIDYANIPWRNRRFDPDELATAAQTESRMLSMWRAWNAHPGTRTVVFCCSIAHATFVRAWLRGRDVRVAAIFSGEGSDDRDLALRGFKDGHLDALCAVDVLNEGIDLPAIDRVVMLRPTESSVVFLQQLGRGLRAADGKPDLTVIDFVGNHVVFLERLRTLLALGSGGTEELRRVITVDGSAELPAGCSVELELEAKELLARLFNVGGLDEIERAYRELRVARGTRPTAGELVRMGYLPNKLRSRHESWFDFVKAEQDLDADELRTLEEAGAFLREVEVTKMTKSFKMVTLQALGENDALLTGMPLADLARRAHAILQRSPDLRADVPETSRGDLLDEVSEARWVAYWRQNPINAWSGTDGGRRWFRVDEDRFVPTLSIDPTLGATYASMLSELVDYRLAQYRRRGAEVEGSREGFVCRVTWNQRDPILKLPSRTANALPEGETDVRLGDGSVWVFKFAKEFCNVARPAGSQRNALPDLLMRWFGPGAGQPGTAFQVRFRAGPNGLWVEPERADHAQIIELPRRAVMSYPDLRAAAGHASGAVVDPEAEQVLLPIEDADPNSFAVRVAGDSMDGGRAPLHDGDWAIFKLARGASASSVQGRVVMVRTPAETTGQTFQIKRIVQRDGRWWLSSDNPDGPQIAGTDDAVVMARLDRSFRPEQLGPQVGVTLGDDAIAPSFGLEEIETRSGRYGGHLFVFVDRPGMLPTTESVRFPGPRRPGETAFVLAKKPGGGWRYLGVGRLDGDDSFRIPEVDYATWKAWGESSGVSRPLPEGARARAQVAVDALLALLPGDRVLTRVTGARAQITGRAAQGGIRVTGEGADSGERTVSLIDLAWVAVADDARRAHGGLLDEARVNQLRYLEGTPRGSTRWIDTGWALAAWERAQSLVPAVSGVVQIVADDGTPMDARFRVEERGGELSVIFESRGGTKGGGDARNTDYNPGLELLLARLQRAGATIASASIDSVTTRALSLNASALAIDGHPYPISSFDPAELRRALGRAQAASGREPGAKGGGNQTKRIRLVVTFPTEAKRRDELVAALRSA